MEASVIISILIGLMTLIATIWLLVIERKEIPWTMDKKDNEIWEITRTGRKSAFVDEVYGDPLCWGDYTTQWIGYAGLGSPSKVINYGEKMLIRIIPNNPEIPISSSFTICYTEKNLPKFDDFRIAKNNISLTHASSENCKNKHWSRALY